MVQDSIRTSNHLNYKIDSTTVQINTYFKSLQSDTTQASILPVTESLIVDL